MSKVLYLLKNLLCAGICVLACIQLGHAQQNNGATPDSARSFMNHVCQIEFDPSGKEARWNYTVMTKKYRKYQLDNGNDTEGDEVQWGWDPLVIIDGFDVVDVRQEGKKFFSTVKYSRIGSSKGKGVLLVEQKKEEFIRYDLVFTDEGWRVIDPPPPRVSVSALHKLYSQLVKNNESLLAGSQPGKLSSAQLNSFERDNLNLNILSTLLKK